MTRSSGLQRLKFGSTSHHLPGNVFDHLERRAEHRFVVAQRDRAGHRHRGIGQRGDHLVLARHVMRRRRQPMQWRAAQHPLRRVVADQEGQVGTAPGNQVRRQLAGTADAGRTQISVQRGKVEPVKRRGSHRTCLSPTALSTADFAAADPTRVRSRSPSPRWPDRTGRTAAGSPRRSRWETTTPAWSPGSRAAPR